MTLDAMIDEVYYDILLAHWVLIRNVIALVVIWQAIAFAFAVFNKRRLIRAALQQTADEVSRIEYITIDQDIASLQALMEKFQIEGRERIRQATRGGALFSFAGDDEADKLMEAASKVADFTRDEYVAFIRRRRLMRHMLDGLEALVGQHKSIETAWASGLVYLEKYCAYKDAGATDMPWVQPYLKAVNLPYNLWARGFGEQMRSAASRSVPPGSLSLWLACRSDFTSRLRYGAMIRKADGTALWVEKQGAEAWQMLLTFKAWHYQRVELMEGTTP